MTSRSLYITNRSDAGCKLCGKECTLLGKSADTEIVDPDYREKLAQDFRVYSDIHY